MDSSERELFQRTIRAALTTTEGVGVDGALMELGFREALVTDRYDAVAALFELQGETCSTSSMLGHVVAAGVGVDADDDRPAVLPPMGLVAAPARRHAGTVEVIGVMLGSFADEDEVLIVASDGEHYFTCGTKFGSLSSRALAGLDPSLHLNEVIGTVAIRDRCAQDDWISAAALGQVAVGYELLGAARRMLELARKHALDRVKFDRPIAGFQAIRHRLADSLVAIEAAEAALDAASLDPTPPNASIAKAVAGRGAKTTARHAASTGRHRIHDRTRSPSLRATRLRS